MARLKVMTIVGTRPEIIKLCRVLAELDQYTDHVLVHSGQNYDYELNEIFFNELGIRRPDHFLEAVGETTAETIGQIIAKSDAVMAAEQPDAILVYGDTNTTLSALSAKRRKIPVFHMEAGNRCFDERVPEEINRRILDHISDINMPLTEHARRYLLDEGIRPETIIKTGSSMTEVLNHYRDRIDASDVLARLELKQHEYFVVSAHREENIDSPENFTALIDTLNALAETYLQPVIVSLHPRTRNRLESHNDSLQKTDAPQKKLHPLIQFSKPFGFFDYIHLQMNARCVLSDSGTITEESSILNFPAVMIRNAHERPEGMDEGTLIMCGLQAHKVLNAVDVVTSQCSEYNRTENSNEQKNQERTFRPIHDYNVNNVSKKVLRIILSYTDYINRTVWRTEK